MDVNEIRATVKKSIANIMGIRPEEIADSASYKDDLAFDSLSMLELVVNMEYQFHIRVPSSELSGIRTVEDTVKAVQQHLCLKLA